MARPTTVTTSTSTSGPSSSTPRWERSTHPLPSTVSARCSAPACVPPATTWYSVPALATRASPPSPSPTHTYFVRGPYTAGAMGGVPFITDPGILMGRFVTKVVPVYPVSFMPRWNSMGSELTTNVEAAGFHLIDPRLDVDTVTRDICCTGLLLTEALHGAIVADAIRVPWISIRAQDHSDFKWYDWCASMDMVWNPIDAVGLGLTWARDYAVPQLSAASVLARKTSEMLATIDAFNFDIEHERVFP